MSASDIIASTSLTITADATSSATISGYTPAEIKKAYGISSISLNGVTGDGTGQTIAIVDAYSDANIASDLATFDTAFGLSAPASFKQVSATGSTTLPKSDAGWDGEIALDVEWAHAIAPKANIILVDATTDSLKNLMAAVKYASSISTVSVVSMSWGSSEFSTESSYDSYFTTPTGHIGITYVAASGDEGAAGGAEYPAVSPNVLSVGGTTLSIGSSGTVTSETAWSDSSGGTSSYETASAAQAAATGTTKAKSPDVSYDANPDTGFAVYDSVADDGYVGWEEVGGTSAGAPQWSALVAIADQERVAKGSSTLDGATGTLPAIYSIYSNATSYAADFTDITSGSSSLGGGGFGGGFGGGGPGGGRFGGRFGGSRQSSSVSATTGYDTLTGVGSPKAASLVSALVNATATSSATATKSVVAKSSKTATVSKAEEIIGATSFAARLESMQLRHAVASGSMLASGLLGPTSSSGVATSSNSMRPGARTTSPVMHSAVDAATVATSATMSGEPMLFGASLVDESFSFFATVQRTADVIASKIDALPLLSQSTPAVFRAARTIGAASIAAPLHSVDVSSNGAVDLLAAALVADGVILGIYHAKKRRQGVEKNPFVQRDLITM